MSTLTRVLASNPCNSQRDELPEPLGSPMPVPRPGAASLLGPVKQRRPDGVEVLVEQQVHVRLHDKQLLVWRVDP